MKALTFQGIKQIEYSEIADPIILHDTDAIVQIQLAGLCGSDLHVYRGHECGLDHGTAMGHEFIGEIVAIGKGVKQFKKGDRIISPFSTNCGQCYYCQIGLTCRCVHSHLYGWVAEGQGLHGGQAEFIRVPFADGTLVPLKENLSDEVALFLGDILSTGYFCADQAQVKNGGIYAVLGCGPVGLMASLSAIKLGAERVYAIDCIPERLKMAEQFGAIPINYKTVSPIEKIKAATEGRGADAVLEAVGSDITSRMAIDIVRPGGRVSAVGVHNSQQFPFSPVEAYDKNLTYSIGRCPARHYMEKLMDEVPTWEDDISAIISHRLALKEGSHAYQIFDQKLDHCLKVIFDLT